ncbi:MAG: hypothetical protein M0042_16310 [Nitrospiraceae bacterium]|nr:hypothetical protein [Nitrospiraceae bacterium]
MHTRLNEIVAKMKELEKELVAEIQKSEEEYYYKVRGKIVTFEEWVKHEQQELVHKLIPWLRESTWPVILTTPVVWACLFPALFLDLMLTLFQHICFPIYGIPKVRRADYLVVMDRRALAYLNIIEKVNCIYCSYFNGMIAYVQEIAGRTEQYWCPIKHARKTAALHSRYIKFFEYGDGKGYREHLEEVRRDFADLSSSEKVEQIPPRA